MKKVYREDAAQFTPEFISNVFGHETEEREARMDSMEETLDEIRERRNGRKTQEPITPEKAAGAFVGSQEPITPQQAEEAFTSGADEAREQMLKRHNLLGGEGYGADEARNRMLQRKER